MTTDLSKSYASTWHHNSVIYPYYG